MIEIQRSLETSEIWGYTARARDIVNWAETLRFVSLFKLFDEQLLSWSKLCTSALYVSQSASCAVDFPTWVVVHLEAIICSVIHGMRSSHSNLVKQMILLTLGVKTFLSEIMDAWLLALFTPTAQLFDRGSWKRCVIMKCPNPSTCPNGGLWFLGCR